MPNQKFLKSTHQVRVRINGRSVDLYGARIVYKCIHCLADLRIKNSGLVCSDNENHYGFIHRDEAKDTPTEVRFMKIGEMFPSEYIRGIDVTEPCKVKILKVVNETMRSRDGGKTEPAYIVYFEGYPKGVRLNLTMAKEIAVILNDKDLDTDNWAGGIVTLYRTTVKAFGNEHIVVRIRAPKPGDKFLGQQKGKPINKLTRVEFANKVKAELGLSPEMAGFILRQAGHVSNGKDWQPEKAPKMWDTLQSIGVAFLGFTSTVLSDIPYYASEKDVMSFLQERNIIFEPGEDSETGLYHLLHQHARSVADMDAGEDEQDQPALWQEEPESNYSAEEA